MKASFRTLIPALGLAAALPAFAAEAATKTDKAEPEVKPFKELRVITSTDGERGATAHRFMQHLGERGAMGSVTFLGVETGPVSATLTAQLGLTEGSGLVVNQVLPDSPAAGALKPHDILLKFDDQILIEQRQLAVLVRGHKDGDEVTLTYVRAGKQATAKVKLVKRDMPKATTMMFNSSGPASGFGWAGGSGSSGVGGGTSGNFDVQIVPPDVLGNREEVNRVLSLIDGANISGQRRMSIARVGGPGDRNVSVTVNTANSRIICDDDKGSIELTIKEGKKQVVAKNTKGEKIFEGAADTPEERKAMPAEVRERLEKIEDMKQFSFTTDADFKGTETKVIRPRVQGISLPAPAAAPAARPPLFF